MSTIQCSPLSTGSSAPPVSYVRFLHASPGTGPVDVFSNGTLVAGGLTYQHMTDYFTVSPGDYCIRVYPAGKAGAGAQNNVRDLADCPERVALTQACLVLSACSAVTVALICPFPAAGLLAIPEVFNIYRRMRNPYQAAIRFVNLSPDAPPLDVLWPDGAALFRGTAFCAHTRYQRLDPGTYAFKLRPAGSRQTGVQTPPFTLERGTAYTLYAVGLTEGAPPLTAILSTDGIY